MKASFKRALSSARNAALVNFRPSLLLQAVMLVFLAFYLFHEPTKNGLARIADLKQESGYLFAFVSYALAAGILPELLRFSFFQKFRPRPGNGWELMTSILIWGGIGMMVDLFYRYQTIWFGPGNDPATIAIKVCVDQFLFSALLTTPLCIALFTLRDARLSFRALLPFTRLSFYVERIFPVQVAGWCVWIPALCLIYFMPPALQLPVASLVQAFWVLMFTTLTEVRKARFS